MTAPTLRGKRVELPAGEPAARGHVNGARPATSREAVPRTPGAVAKPIARAFFADSDRDWHHLGSYGRGSAAWERLRSRRRVVAIVFALDFAVLALSFAAVPLFRGTWREPYVRVAVNLGMHPSTHAGILIVFAAMPLALWLWVLRNLKLYDSEVFRDRVTITQRVIHATAVAFGVPAFIAAAIGEASMRDFILISLPLGLIWLLFSHLVLQRLLLRIHLGTSEGRLLTVVTQQQYADRVRPEWRAIAEKWDIAGYVIVDGDRTVLVDADGEPVDIACGVLCADALEALGVDGIVVICPGSVSPEWIRRMTWACTPLGVEVYLYPNLASVRPQRVSVSRIQGQSVMKVQRAGNVSANGVLKRLFDVVVGALLVIAFSPVLLATAIAVKAGDGGPVFYRATRIGRDGEEFRMWKFRSMRVDADTMRERLVEQTGQGNLLFKIKDDPRVTKVGRFIRRYSIDELPQLFNVVGGSMSLVGPRPQIAQERDEYDADAWMRLTVRPGMTGLWQVSGRSNLSPEESIALDLLYVDNWTPSLDFNILFRTAKAVIGKDGAY